MELSLIKGNQHKRLEEKAGLFFSRRDRHSDPEDRQELVRGKDREQEGYPARGLCWGRVWARRGSNQRDRNSAEARGRPSGSLHPEERSSPPIFLHSHHRETQIIRWLRQPLLHPLQAGILNVQRKAGANSVSLTSDIVSECWLSWYFPGTALSTTTSPRTRMRWSSWRETSSTSWRNVMTDGS